MVSQLVTVVFLFCFFVFWLHHVACGILAPWPGIEPMPPAVEERSPNHWTAKEVPVMAFFNLLFNVILSKEKSEF